MLLPYKPGYLLNITHSRVLNKLHTPAKGLSHHSNKQNYSAYSIETPIYFSSYQTPIQCNRSFKKQLSQCKLKGYVHSRQSENRNMGCDVSVECGDDKVRYKSELKIPRRDFAEESQIFSNYMTKLQRTSFSISANKHLTYSCYLKKLTSKLNSDDIIMRHKSLQGRIKLTFPVQVPKIRLLKTCSSQQSVVYISKLKL